MKTILSNSFKVLFLLIVLFFTQCQKDQSVQDTRSADTQKVKSEDAKQKLISLIKEKHLTPYTINRNVGGSENTTEEARTNLESRGSDKRRLPTNADFNFYYSIAKRAIDPNDYVCGSTILDDYFNNAINNLSYDGLVLWIYFGNVSLDIADIYDNTSGGEYYGSTGQYNSIINKSVKDLKRFWNIPTDILMGDAHGKIYANEPLVADLLYNFYGYDQSDAIQIAHLCNIVFGSAEFQYYNHPILTFNAFAEPGYLPLGIVKKLVMGDGIMQFYQDAGFGDVAPQAILAHEYGHHVQFALNVDFGFSPEATRRTELMADALSAYFMTHKQGVAMNWKRVQSFLQVFYSIGDCAFNNLGHHGTPNQRMKSAAFGYSTASSAQKQGQVLTGQQFIALFDAALPGIVAPDAN